MYRVVLTLFGIGRVRLHVGEILVQEDMYRVVLTVFGMVWLGHT
jgi:hypothetical protein